MKTKNVSLTVLLFICSNGFACFDALFNFCRSSLQKTNRNEYQENLLSRKELDHKYVQIEEVTRFEIQRQTQLFNRGKIGEIEFKKNLAFMYTELLCMLPQDRLKKLFPAIQLTIVEK